MANDAQKLWLQQTLNLFGQKKAVEAIQQLGRSLPCSVSAIPVAGVPVVTVQFEVMAAPFTLPKVTVPIAGFEYIRFPVQVGCRGFVMAADAYLGGVTGIGGGQAQFGVQPGNLSALVFVPLGNAGWEPSDEPEKVVIYGPDGVVIRSPNKNVKVTVTNTGVVVDVPVGTAMTVNGKLIVVGDLNIGGSIKAADGSVYAGNLVTSGNVIALSGPSQVGLATHTHTQPNDSHGDTEQATNAPSGGT